MKKGISLKTIRVILLLIWTIISLVLLILVLTIGNNNLELRPYIDKVFRIYLWIMPFYCIMLSVITSIDKRK